MHATMRIKRACGLALAVALTGCATLSGQAGPNLNLLKMALTIPPNLLTARAEKGDARAQAALAIVYEYGLDRMSRDGGQATSLRQKATASRGYTPITQYIPGLNGAPGRTAIINIPNYGVPQAEIQRNRACADALDAGRDDASSIAACGDAPNYQALKSLWDKARGP